HDRVSGREGWGDLPREHEEREVPRDDLGRHAERAGGRPEAHVLELVGPARVVEEPGRDERDVDVPALLDGLAVVEALGDRELAGPLLDEPGDAEEVLATVRAAHARPRRLVRPACRVDGGVDVDRIRARDRREAFLGRWRDRGERLAATLDELSVDEEAVLVAQAHDVPRLR